MPPGPKKHIKSPKKIPRGILIMVTSDTTDAVLLTVKSISKLSTLPITLYYNSNHDIELEPFKHIHGLHFLPLKIDYQGQERMAAILNCNYKSVLVIDPNMFFLINPEILFDAPEFINTGAVFWLDKQIKTNWDHKIQDWVREFFPFKIDHNPILNRETGTFISGSIFLLNLDAEYLDKCSLIYKKIGEIQSRLGSEKECYWIISEILKRGYYVNDHQPCILASKNSSLMCGETGFLLSNEHLVCIQFKQLNNLVDLEFVATSGEWTAGGDCMLNPTIEQIPQNVSSYINEILKSDF